MGPDEGGALRPYGVVAGALGLRDAGEHVTALALDEAIEDEVASSRTLLRGAVARARGTDLRAYRLGPPGG